MFKSLCKNSVHIVWIIGIVAFLVRIGLLSIIFAHNDYEAVASVVSLDGYYDIANNLVHGHGFSGFPTPPYLPNSSRVPVYPFFLAFILWVFKSHLAIAIIQTIIGVTIPLLARLIVLRVTDNHLVANTGGLFLAVEPYTALLSITMLTETVFTALFLLCVLYLYHFLEHPTYRAIVISATSFALATLTRPNIQFLFPFVIGLIIWRYRRSWSWPVARQVALFIIIPILLLTPWLYRNYHVFGRVALTDHVNANLYLYLVPSVLALEKNIPYEAAKLEFYKTENLQNINDVYNLKNEKEYTNRALAVLKEHPLGIAKSLGTTFVAFFTHDGYLDLLQRFDDRPVIIPHSLSSVALINKSGAIILAGRLLWFIITISFLFGAIQFIRKNPRSVSAWFALFLIFYFLGTTTIIGLGVNARFRFAVNPFIIMFAIYGWYSLLTRSVEEQKSKLT